MWGTLVLGCSRQRLILATSVGVQHVGHTSVGVQYVGHTSVGVQQTEADHPGH